MSRYADTNLIAEVSFEATETLPCMFMNVIENLDDTIEIIGGKTISIEFDNSREGFRLKFSYPAHKSISKIVSTLKSRSSRMLGCKWKREYCAHSLLLSEEGAEKEIEKKEKL